MADKPNVVLVHGGFVDGSGWQGVYDLLTADGYRVDVVQNPTLSLEGDAAATRMVLDRQDGPTVLVGHSYGGAGSARPALTSVSPRSPTSVSGNRRNRVKETESVA